MDHYRDIPKNRILRFNATPGFKGFSSLFSEASKAHPAKLNLNLLMWIINNHTKRGDLILDPMAGTGSTVILGSMVGRNGIAVEYEPRFCDMINDSIARLRKQVTLTPKGRVTCIHGDARKLREILTPDVIIFSPPYGNRLADAAIHDDDPQRVSYRQAVDVILTSPPFGPSSKGGGIVVDGYKAPGEEVVSDPTIAQRQGRPLSDDPANIDNLKYGEFESIGTMKGETYMDAMLEVYTECYKVLKIGGLMILVVKNFNKDRQVVRLDDDTIALAQKAGFNLRDRWYFKLPNLSFWLNNYYKKNPEVSRVLYEDVIIFKKYGREGFTPDTGML